MLTQKEYNITSLKLYGLFRDNQKRAEQAKTMHSMRYFQGVSGVYRDAYMNLKCDTGIMKRVLAYELDRVMAKHDDVLDGLQRRKLVPKPEVGNLIACEFGELDGKIYAYKQVIKLL